MVTKRAIVRQVAPAILKAGTRHRIIAAGKAVCMQLTQHFFMELILTRRYDAGGTNGTLSGIGIKANSLFTIELPWRDNEKQRSCIPEGRYEIVPRYSLRRQRHFMLRGVPGRRLILLHPANKAARELKGCIAPVTTLTGPGDGLESRKAFYALSAWLNKALEQGPVFLRIVSLLKDQPHGK